MALGDVRSGGRERARERERERERESAEIFSRYTQTHTAPRIHGRCLSVVWGGPVVHRVIVPGWMEGLG